MTPDDTLISFAELFEPAPVHSVEPDSHDPQSLIIEPIPDFTLTTRGHETLETLSESALAELEEHVQTTRARMARAYIFAMDWDDTLFDRRPEHVLGLLSRYRKEAPDTFRVDVEAPASDPELVHAVVRVRDVIFQMLREGVEGFEKLESQMEDLAYETVSDIEDGVEDLGVEFLNEDARRDAEFDVHASLLNDLPSDVSTARDQRLFLIHTMADRMLNLVIDSNPEEPPFKKPSLRIVD